MGGGEPVATGQFRERIAEGGRYRVLLLSLPRQQARTGHRGEWHSDLELGVVIPAGLLVGIGPALIEDVFAARMRLQISRRDPDDLAR